MTPRPAGFYVVNTITLYRLLSAPVILWLAIIGEATLFKWLIAFSFFTDAIDGFLSRVLKVSSVFGARLDSLADDATVLVATIGLWFAYPDFVWEHWPWIVALLSLFAMQNVAALVMYHRVTSFHTYLAKLAAVLQAVFFLLLFFDLPFVLPAFYAAVMVTGVQLIEEIVLVFYLPEWQADVKGMFWVIHQRKKDAGR